MKACASLGPVPRSGVSVGPFPVVLVDNFPEPRLAVESLTVSGPLDRRSARILMDEPAASPEVVNRWMNSNVVVAWPSRLSDEMVAWPVFIRGGLKRVASEESSGERARAFDLVSAWDDMIATPVENIWAVNPAGALFLQVDGKLFGGRDGNRSLSTFSVSGMPIHVIQEGSGLAWDVRTVLETVSVLSELELILVGIPSEIMNAEIDDTIDLTGPVSDILKNLFEAYGLTLQREVSRRGGVIEERRVVRPVVSGRPIRVVWGDDVQPMGDALSVKAGRPLQTSQLWIARAGGWLVESTFELVKAWNPSLQGQSNDEYDKNLSSDFSTYADVYRRWVLNEDGFYSASPYHQGPAFDLAAFFGEGAIDPQPLKFELNLTLDEDGVPLKPIVEMSTDSGANWSVFPAASDILDDRAGVYLDPTSLPTTFLDAAKLGTARIRVTASLHSPQPTEVPRWRGNAFVASLPALTFDLSDRFLFQRVDAGSIHFDEVVSGALVADEVDDGNRMLDWLLRRMRDPDRGGRAVLELAGPWPMLRPGDRLLDVMGPGVSAGGQAQAMTRQGGHVHSYTTEFVSDQRGGRTTRVDLIF